MQNSNNKNNKSFSTKKAPNMVELNQQVSAQGDGPINLISTMTEDEKVFVEKIKSMFQPQTEEHLHYALFEHVVAK